LFSAGRATTKRDRARRATTGLKSARLVSTRIAARLVCAANRPGAFAPSIGIDLIIIHCILQ
jgi:hypothetical protein